MRRHRLQRLTESGTVGKVRIWYHSDLDGFGAAFAAWVKFGDGAVYQPVQYGEKDPEFNPGDKIFIIDFSFSREKTEEIASTADLTVIDHHFTAQAELGDLPYCHFDLSKSGAVLSWEYFHPGAEVPRLLLLVQDRDLWKFEMEGTAAANFALSSHPFDFQVWKTFCGNVDGLIAEGAHIERMAAVWTKEAFKTLVFAQVGDNKWGVLNSSILKSEIAASVIESGEAEIVGVYHDTAKGRIWSLRCTANRNVAEIARGFGGGGHPQAAGFIEDHAGQYVKPITARTPEEE